MHIKQWVGCCAKLLGQRNALLVVVIGLALSGLSIPVGQSMAPVAQAAFPGRNGKLVYEVIHSDWNQAPAGIYVINPDGTGRVRLTRYGIRPHWSPNGRRIAFLGDGIELMDLDGKNRTQILYDFDSYMTSLSWSPDGTQFAFTGTKDANLYVVNVDGTGLRQIAKGALDADWSPDGQRIVFARTIRSVYPAIYTLHTIAPDGSDEQNIQDNDAPNRGPSWSPDSKQIAFFDGAKGLCVMSADGTNHQLIGSKGSGPIAWAPDGSRLIYGDGSVYILSLDGRDRYEVPNSVDASAPDWQPLLSTSTAHF